MNRRRLALARTMSRALALCVPLALAACEEVPGGGDSAGPQAAQQASVLRVEERDVERPDIFEMEANGLWDGRPSLGGQWVAVPRDINADRVKITNLDNNRQIEGALFKVEAGRPGPPILVSSEAAEPLGMLPGSPARMHIVVVRRETVEIPGAPVPVEEPVETEEGAEDQDGDGAGATAVAAAAASAPAETVAPLSDDALETTVLGALDGGTDAAPAEPEPQPEPAAEPETGQDALNALVASAVGIGGDLTLPYLQVASGTDRARMEEAVRKLNGEGYGATIRESNRDDGSVFFRAVSGPFGNEGARSAALKKIRTMGYKDAFPVK